MRANAKYKPQFVKPDLIDALTKPQWADVAHKLASLLGGTSGVPADEVLAEVIKEIVPAKPKRAPKAEKTSEAPSA